MATAKRGQESIQIAAAPEDVYDLLADVTRMGEWSPECYRCEWLDGATTADVGARFRGYNLLGRFRWATTAVVIAAQRGREFAFTVVHDKTGRDETRWRYRLEPSAGGTLRPYRSPSAPAARLVTALVAPKATMKVSAEV
jgi:hypothetical protein